MSFADEIKINATNLRSYKILKSDCQLIEEKSVFARTRYIYIHLTNGDKLLFIDYDRGNHCNGNKRLGTDIWREMLRALDATMDASEELKGSDNFSKETPEITIKDINTFNIYPKNVTTDCNCSPTGFFSEFEFRRFKNL